MKNEIDVQRRLCAKPLNFAPDSCAYEPPSSEYSCSREQFPDNVVGEVISTLRLYKNTLLRALKAIAGKSQA